jgi:hypothetical protein
MHKFKKNISICLTSISGALFKIFQKKKKIHVNGKTILSQGAKFFINEG